MEASFFENRLLFFKAERYEYGPHHIFDVSNIPRPHFCMGLVLEGRGIYRNAETDEHIEIARGDIIFVPVGCRYVSEWQSENRNVYISMHFYFAPPATVSREQGFRLQKVHLRDFDALLSDYAFVLSHFESKEPHTHLAVLSRFFGVLARVLPHLTRDEHPFVDNRISAAVRYIEEHSHEALSVERLAAVAGMSVPRFYSAFKRALGTSPIVYVNRCRVGRAILLLVQNDGQSIEAISEAVGFASAAYFRRVFHTATGKSPKEYRKSVIEI